MGPGHALQRPLIARILFSQLFPDLAEHGVIVRDFVVAYAAPVDRFGDYTRVTAALDDGGVTLLGVCKFLMHELNARQAHLQTRAKPVLRQVTIDAITLNSGGIHHEDRRSPTCAEPFEQCRMFLDVSLERDESLVDEVGSFLVVV